MGPLLTAWIEQADPRILDRDVHRWDLTLVMLHFKVENILVHDIVHSRIEFDLIVIHIRKEERARGFRRDRVRLRVAEREQMIAALSRGPYGGDRDRVQAENDRAVGRRCAERR